MALSCLELFYSLLIFSSFCLFLGLTIFWLIKIKKHQWEFQTKIIFAWILLLMVLMNILAISAFCLEIIHYVVFQGSYQIVVLLPIWLTFFAWFLGGILIIIRKQAKRSGKRL